MHTHTHLPVSHLHLSPSGPPNSTPSPTAPPLPTSPANPGYQVTPPMYNAPPHHPPSSPYQYQHPYAGYPPPSPHTQPPIGSTPYPPYYTSPPGGYAPPVPYPPGQPSPQGGYAPPMPYQPGQPFPGSPYNTHYQPPPGPVVTSVLMTPPQTYPYHPVSPVGGPPQHGSPGGITHDNPPQYGALFPGSVSGGVSGDKVDLGDSQTVSSTPQTGTYNCMYSNTSVMAFSHVRTDRVCMLYPLNFMVLLYLHILFGNVLDFFFIIPLK